MPSNSDLWLSKKINLKITEAKHLNGKSDLLKY